MARTSDKFRDTLVFQTYLHEKAAAKNPNTVGYGTVARLLKPTLKRQLPRSVVAHIVKKMKKRVKR